jgi:ADP-heptose:LPS heptosyltransferase
MRRSQAILVLPAATMRNPTGLLKLVYKAQVRGSKPFADRWPGVRVTMIRMPSADPVNKPDTSRVRPTTPPPTRLDASAFPVGTPLNAFFAWNEARLVRDRRYIVARDIHRLLRRFDGDIELCVSHLVSRPIIWGHWSERLIVPTGRIRAARGGMGQSLDPATIAAARCLVDSLLASIGTDDIDAHAAVFTAFENLANHVNLDALARWRPRRTRVRAVPRKILIIKLGALGDFVQALGPMPEIRRRHADDHITLLTTSRYAELASETRLFDEILIDRRPKALDLVGWLTLRRTLERGRFDRVYDLQTSDRSGIYAWLFRPGRMPEWSGIAWRCSHPHANRERNRQHTMERQAEQLLMAGIYPVSVVPSLPSAGSLPVGLVGKTFAILIPGSSPRHLAKRWPVRQYGELAMRLQCAGYLPVLVGVHGEARLGRVICEVCPEALDLIGCTDVPALAALARAAALTVGNDTGAAHVAAAGGNPVVVLFSQASDPKLCAPRGKIVHVLTEPNLADLCVDKVFTAAMEVARRPVVPAAS